MGLSFSTGATPTQISAARHRGRDTDLHTQGNLVHRWFGVVINPDIDLQEPTGDNLGQFWDPSLRVITEARRMVRDHPKPAVDAQQNIAPQPTGPSPGGAKPNPTTLLDVINYAIGGDDNLTYENIILGENGVAPTIFESLCCSSAETEDPCDEEECADGIIVDLDELNRWLESEEEYEERTSGPAAKRQCLPQTPLDEGDSSDWRNSGQLKPPTQGEGEEVELLEQCADETLMVVEDQTGASPTIHEAKLVRSEVLDDEFELALDEIGRSYENERDEFRENARKLLEQLEEEPAKAPMNWTDEAAGEPAQGNTEEERRKKIRDELWGNAFDADDFMTSLADVEPLPAPDSLDYKLNEIASKRDRRWFGLENFLYFWGVCNAGQSREERRGHMLRKQCTHAIIIDFRVRMRNMLYSQHLGSQHQVHAAMMSKSIHGTIVRALNKIWEDLGLAAHPMGDDLHAWLMPVLIVDAMTLTQGAISQLKFDYGEQCLNAGITPMTQQ